MSTVAELKQSSSDKYTRHYTGADIIALNRILHWVEDGRNGAAERSIGRLARRANLTRAHATRLVMGLCEFSPSEGLNKLWEATKDYDVDDGLVVETTVYRLVISACKRARRYHDIGLIAARPGTGKTLALQAYAASAGHCFLVEAIDGMGAGLLLKLLCDYTGAAVRTARRDSTGTYAARLEAIVARLSGTGGVILIDEADTLTPQSLEVARRISDLAQVGLVLAGEPKLHHMLLAGGRYSRIASRVGFWPPIIEGITEDDAAAIARALHGDEDLSDEALDAYWQLCNGSARVLAKLVADTQEQVKRKSVALDGPLIIAVGQKMLGISKKVTVKRVRS